jgi:predicted aminopeptidase
MKTSFRIFIRVILAIIILLVVWTAFNFSLVMYGYDQLKGQLHIVRNVRPLTEMMNDKNVPDSVKNKIAFIDSVKQFAVDTLGLKSSENYTSFYDQGNKPLLWIITASEPYKIKAYEWKFPVLGSVSYKGFFDYDKGKEEEISLAEKGYDTDYSEVSAWSTLGWFHDPVLSNMIYRSKGQLAELIIHELTHATIYLKSNVNLNENLASVCGEEGAIHFLRSTYGENSGELRQYIERKEDYDKFSRQMLIGAHMLDSLFTQMNDSLVILKLAAKKKIINSIVQSLDTVSFHSKLKYTSLFKSHLPNNAYFIDFIRYDAQKSEMKNELRKKFNGNISAFIESLRKKYK